jgi:hypothetical protein
MTDPQRLEVSVMRTMIRIMRDDAYLDDSIVERVVRLAMDDRIFTDEQVDAIEESLRGDLRFAAGPKCSICGTPFRSWICDVCRAKEGN